MEFIQVLRRAGITKAELARRLKLTENGVAKWRDSPPGYALAYLNLLIEYNRVRP